MNDDSFFNFSKYLPKGVHAVLAKKGISGQNPDSDRIKNCMAAAGLNPAQVSIPNQTHSDHVSSVSSPGIIEDTDGLITREQDLILTLSVADCVPVFIGDDKTGQIGLIHSGWRGTAKNICSNGIKKFTENGSDPGDISAFLGPSICGTCYEVGEYTANYFKNDGLYQLTDEKWLLDLKKVIKVQLMETGIPDINISLSEICTRESKECESYRRNGTDAGRMTALMWKSN